MARNLFAEKPKGRNLLKTEDSKLTPKQLISEPGIINKASAAVVEPLATVLSGLGAQAAAGLETLGRIPFQGMEEAIKEGEKTQQDFTYEPRTESGRAGLETLGELVEKGVDLANIPLSGIAGLVDLIGNQDLESATKTIEDVKERGFFTVLGDKVLEETESPLLATMAKTSPEIIGSYIPLKGLKSARVKRNRQLLDRVESKPTGKLSEITEAADFDALDPDLAKYKVETTPPSQIRAELGLPKTGPLRPEDTQQIQDLVSKSKTLKTNTQAVESAKQGFDEGVLRAIDTADPSNRKKLMEMVEIYDRGRTNKAYQVSNRPADVVGRSVTDRIQYLYGKNKEAGKAVDLEAKNLKGQSVDFGEATDKFIDRLSEEGVTFGADMKPNFVGSIFDGAEGAEKLINKTFKRMEKAGALDAYDIHRMKKFIDEQVDFAKKSQGGLSGKAENIIKGFRRDLDTVLDNNFPDYDRVNTQFRETIEPLNQINNALKIKTPMDSPRYVSAVGQEMRKVMSNYKSRNELIDSLENIENAAKAQGGKFDDDVLLQALFANELDAVMGPVARTSLAGTMAQEMKRGTVGASSKAEVAANIAATAKDKLKGINEDNAIKWIKEFLKTPQN